MSDHIQQTIDDALNELRARESSVIELKKLINQLCQFAHRDPMFTDKDMQIQADKSGPLVRKNSFYGKPLATCIKEYLVARSNANLVKEATLDEIVEALTEGSFDLRSLCKDEKDAKRVVAISLGKNVAFHRLPNGDYGLAEWYDLKKRKERNGGDNGADLPDSVGVTTEDSAPANDSNPSNETSSETNQP